MEQPSPAFAPAPIYKFGALIEAFRTVYRAGRSQLEITAQALIYKRQLESLGLFPGLQRGTPERLSANGRDGIIGYDENGPMYGRLTRGDRKRLARDAAKANVSEARLDKYHHSAVRAGMGILDQAYEDRISSEDRDVIETAMAAPVPAYEFKAVPSFSVVNTPDGRFGVVGTDGKRHGGPYLERKTANRRAKQLNEAG